jgi:DNA-binding transcriptional MerR regulator
MQSELSRTDMDGTAARDEYTISDLARLYDVSLRTLRFYEDKGLLHPRRQGTARYYKPSDRIRLELILKGKRLGFTLSEISALIASNEKKSAAQEPAAETSDLTVSLDRHQIQAQIAYLERQRDELDGAIAELREASGRMMSDALD